MFFNPKEVGNHTKQKKNLMTLFSLGSQEIMTPLTFNHTHTYNREK